jgi:hypothetical protein
LHGALNTGLCCYARARAGAVDRGTDHPTAVTVDDAINDHQTFGNAEHHSGQIHSIKRAFDVGHFFHFGFL